ncbi:unnamed protein product [Vitrella brassicaformis CCMP3155]|uniref:Uncharacterized protein n=1 Tax=Vitrella brassicaformis (strain CCMP3155) TaxID=1169540 RepID=A0A0G4FBF0_VITBC|nr:unnamed protein product [Vitrella brassicaformis CCMP3155]|eukprot:CEM10236.1 unnamed protein product [Vitrella brassicaformis CCMP3155]
MHYGSLLNVRSNNIGQPPDAATGPSPCQQVLDDGRRTFAPIEPDFSAEPLPHQERADREQRSSEAALAGADDPADVEDASDMTEAQWESWTDSANLRTEPSAADGFIYRHPKPRAILVSPKTSIALRAPIQLKRPSIRDKVRVRADEGGFVGGKVLLTRDGRTLLWTPLRLFKAGETVTVKVASGILGEDGTAMGGVMWQFRVSPNPLRLYDGPFTDPDDGAEEWRAEAKANYRRKGPDADAAEWHLYGPFMPSAFPSLSTSTEQPAGQPHQEQQQAEEPPLVDAHTASAASSAGCEIEGSSWPKDEEAFRRVYPTMLSETFLQPSPTGSKYGNDTPGNERPYLIITDKHGQLVYWRRHTSQAKQRVVRLTDEMGQRGNLIYRDRLNVTDREGKRRGATKWVEMNHDLQRVRTHKAGHGYQADQHDIAISADGKRRAFLIVDTQLTDVGRWLREKENKGGASGADDRLSEVWVYVPIVQVLDEDDNIVMEWRASDTWPIPELVLRHEGSVEALIERQKANPNGPMDVAHINSVSFTPDGNLLVSLRHLNVLEVDVNTGRINWMLGGSATDRLFNDFAIDEDSRFREQHHVRMLGSGHITLFDNRNPPPGDGSTPKYSRALELKIIKHNSSTTSDGDFPYSVKTVWEHRGPYGLAMGWVQRFANGNTGINWGGLANKETPFYQEVTADGSTVFEMKLTSANGAYSTYKGVWWSRPTRPPLLTMNEPLPAAADTDTPIPAALHFSWNGATNVKEWEVYGGLSSPPSLLLGRLNKRLFEHRWPLDQHTMQAVRQGDFSHPCGGGGAAKTGGGCSTGYYYFRVVPVLHDGRKGQASAVLGVKAKQAAAKKKKKKQKKKKKKKTRGNGY